MKPRYYILPLLLLFATCVVYPQKVYNNCGMEGSAKTAKLKQLNRDKNRYNAPKDEDIDDSISLSSILAPGDDEQRYSNTQAAEITGYVIDVKMGGIESCNCKATASQFRDTHIELVADPKKTSQTLRVIVEMTPRIRQKMKAKGIDWSTSALKSKFLHKWVKVKGWMLFDAEHWYNAENTNPDGDNIWRATSWEIHPVTSIEVVSH